ncbi:MAG: hypothetical protein OYH77_05075, partial [Pseudomonadota bacterium]|nr:hypothetical protein [Pseudomonadota bacterium]
MRCLFITLFVISITGAEFASGSKGTLTRFSKVLRHHKQDLTARTRDLIWRAGKRIERTKHRYYWYGTAVS